MKILIIEDEDMLSNVIKEEFSDAGYVIEVAKDGEEALGLAKNFLPQLILLDLVLPKKGGLDVLSEIKSDPELKKVPVIILSNMAEDESIKKALAMGAEDYFIKAQNSISEILEKVRKYIKKF